MAALRGSFLRLCLLAGVLTLPALAELRLRLVDAESGKPISGVEASIHSDNGIRCIKAPCPTNGRTWKGVSGKDGVVKAPSSALQKENQLTASGYEEKGNGSASCLKGRKPSCVVKLTRRYNQ